MKLKTVQNLGNLQEIEELSRFVAQFAQDVVSVVNGNLSLLENLKGTLVDVTFSAISTDVQIPHQLRSVPTGYIVVGRSADIQVFDGAAENTSQFLYVRASALGTARLYVF